MVNGPIAAEAIKKAYIDPIRSVMLVDDRFHTFAELARPRPPAEEVAESASPAVKYEDDRAATLWEACRKRGWACDVENGPEFSALVTSRIQKCDLVVLDFHLVGQDPAPSLKLMRELAESPGSNLVILYTVDPNLDTVRRRVSANLRGARKLEDWLTEEELQAWQDLPDGIPSFSSEQVDSFLRGDQSYKSDASLRDQLADANIDASLRAKLLEASLEKYLEKELGAVTLLEPRFIEMSGNGAPHGWVRQDNAFVVFVSKLAQNGVAVFEALESALANWSPSPVHLTVAYAREAIARGGIKLDTRVLSDDHIRTGLLYHALEEGPETGIRNWCGRLIDGVAQFAIDEVAEFGSDLIDGWPKNVPEQGNLQRSKFLAKWGGDGEIAEFEILVALNEFLCSEPYRGKHLKTGTLFCHADGSTPDSLWICVTPACDMVPREPSKDRWERTLHPLRPMMVLCAKAAEMRSALKRATDGRHVFYASGPARVAAEVIRDNGKPLNEMMVVEDQALTDAERCFHVHRIRQHEGNPSFGQRIKMRAVAQLRPQYASRLLQETGSYVSRIGVDFVNFNIKKA